MNLGNDITEIHSTAREVLQREYHNEIYQLGQSSCWNCRELKRENMNFGYQVVENGRKKKNCDGWNLGRKLKKSYVHNIFTTNYRWLVVISSNMNLVLWLLF